MQENRPVLSRTPVLENVSLGRRALAYCAVTLGNAVAVAARRQTARCSALLLVAFANLGDQLRMMNVWSRYASEDDPVDVVCNRPTAEAFSLYAGVRTVREFASQGAQSLSESVRNLFTTTAQYERAFVPHPFFTRPIALAYARTHAAATIAMAGRGATAGTTVPLDPSSWRATYERFASACFPERAPRPLPRLAAGIGYAGARSRQIVVHVASSEESRTLDPIQTRAIVAGVVQLGLRICVVGSAREEPRLRATFEGLDVSFTCGAPLRDVMELLCSSDLFLGVDSSLMHMADAVGIPSVVIYTATCAEIAGPYYTRFVAIEPSQDFKPAGVQPEYSWRAPRGTRVHIGASAVTDAVQRLLGAA